MASAWVQWHGLSGDSVPAVTASSDAESRDFATFADAFAWAQARAERVETFVYGLGEWVGPPEPSECAAIEASVERARRRFAAEQQAYESPVEWFAAFLDPDVDDVDRLADEARGTPNIVDADVVRHVRRNSVEQWLVVRVLACSKDDATAAAFHALIELVWPPEHRPSGPWMASVGRHEEAGLAEFVSDLFA
jgi:hypothetical protein